MDTLLNTLKFVHKMSADIIKFFVAVKNRFIWCWGSSLIIVLQWFWN